ncbi:MAG: Ig-like domain-containing protein [bacterium]
MAETSMWVGRATLILVLAGTAVSREAQSMAAFAPLQPPSVAISSPLDNETVSQANLTIIAAASGGAGVTNVEFYADGSFLGSDDTDPYIWIWNSAPLGDHALTARAYDAAAHSGTSASVRICVTNNLPPKVSITMPAKGMVVSTNFTIAATATDDVAVTNVCFYDGNTLLGSDDASPYSYVWNGAPLGAHTLQAVAWDQTGWAATSTVEVTVILQRAQHVVVISVDGMGSAYVKPLLVAGITNELTTFKRIQADGSGTLNARDDADYAVTLPNHITMMTGRGVLGEAGHNWTENTDPALTDTLESNKGLYIASGFDVAHDNGLRTGLWSGKSKFNLFQQSYNDTSGALDTTGFDNGRDKITFDKVESSISAAELTTDFTNRMSASPFHFVFFHYQDPDKTGHASGWSTNPASAFAATLKEVDTQIGNILQMVESSPGLQGNTVIILTADHGGHGKTHGGTPNPLDFTIPFYVWGASGVAGGDLYAMNPTCRTSPGPTANPPYTGLQPVRNGEAANLALDMLGLGPVPDSTIDSAQELQVETLLPAWLGIRMKLDQPLVEWTGTNAWHYTLEFTPSLAPLVPWSNVLGYVRIPGLDGTMFAKDTNDVSCKFYRVRMTR